MMDEIWNKSVVVFWTEQEPKLLSESPEEQYERSKTSSVMSGVIMVFVLIK